MLTIITDIGLFACQTITWFMIGLIGFFLIDRNAFGKALLLVFFTMIYNTYLKYLWQEPLPLPMHGWAFPSGHMHSAFVFWGWLAIEARRFWVSIATAVLLIFIGYAMIHEWYHYPRDVVGAMAFGSLSLALFYALSKLRIFQVKPYLLSIPLIIIGGICILLMPAEARKPHIWQGMWGLVLLPILWICLAFCPKSLSLNAWMKSKRLSP